MMIINNALIDYIKKPKEDERYTPEEAIIPILKYLPKDKTYWECTDFGASKITKVLREHGFKVISSGINSTGTRQELDRNSTGTRQELDRNSTGIQYIDFLSDTPTFDFDIIITNPPYSLKNDFLKKCYEYNKPFLLLLPITALEGKIRGELFRKYGIEVIVFNKRINFLQKKNVWFNTSWFCHEILKEKLIFEDIINQNQEE